MAHIKDVVQRINSITATQQITKAMKMVAAAKLTKVQQQVLQLRPYAEKLATLLDNVTARTKQELAQCYTEKRNVQKLLLVVMTADRGLCGSFNTNVLKKTMRHIDQEVKLPPEQIELLLIGKKAVHFFQKEKFKLITTYSTLSQHLNFEHVSQAAAFILGAFQKHTYDQVALVYNAFKSAAIQVAQVEQFLPIVSPNQHTQPPKPMIDYIYEPSKAALMEALLPQSLKIQFYKALLESNASEHGARLTTMSKATDNAGELLKVLRITYNRTRQAAITNEIAEIVAGATALSD